MTNELGTLQRAGARWVLRYERRYRHPPEKVWRALVEPSELSHWFPARIEGDRRAGARLAFVFDGDEGPPLEGVIRVFEPPRTLEYTWDDEVLRWELRPTAEGCVLEFSTTFDGRAKAPRDATGWHLCLAGLARRLDGSPDGPKEAWVALYDAYSRTLGIGDFPAFLKAGAERVDDVLGVSGLAGYAFGGRAGARMIACHAVRDATGNEHTSALESYLVVLEGQLVLQLGVHEFELRPGVEFVVPAGSPIRARVRTGTRLIHAFAQLSA